MRYSWRQDEVTGRCVNCCDQEALIGLLKSLGYPGTTLTPEELPECARAGDEEAIGTHYNCIGETVDGDRMLRRAQAMRANGQWLLTEGECADYPER
mmetsp:Transcript_17706/g.55461  ORF Transcript_17706/g.55461 Transcript_17706/m.55461 type:complete len:97 (-) Transcript_17706:13-303(-)